MAAKTKKKRIYNTTVTRRVMGLSMLPILPAIALLYFAADAFKKFAPSDPFRMVFAGVPTLIAFILVGAVIATIVHFNNREVVIEGDNITYRDDKTEMTLVIRKMAFSPPGDSGPVKFLMFSDGETFVNIPRLFMKEGEFEELVEQIKKRRRKARQSSGPGTYSL